jgi:hypothetical protein
VSHEQADCHEKLRSPVAVKHQQNLVLSTVVAVGTQNAGLVRYETAKQQKGPADQPTYWPDVLCKIVADFGTR